MKKTNNKIKITLHLMLLLTLILVPIFMAVALTTYKDTTLLETDETKKVIEKTYEVKQEINLERKFEELEMYEMEIENSKNQYNSIIDELTEIKSALGLKLTLPAKK